jgi:peptidoglycan hydrolase-like protein with peptidoglycan-binding domain
MKISKSRGLLLAMPAAAMVASSSMVLLGNAPKAGADTQWPPGCAINANDPSGSWQYLCYVGLNDWNTDRTAIGNVTIILSDLYYGGFDCNYTTTDQSNLQSYQRAYGLTADGIAGPATYSSLESRLTFSNATYGISSLGQPTEQLFYTVGAGPLRYDKWLEGGGVEANGQWNVQFIQGDWKWIGVFSC